LGPDERSVLLDAAVVGKIFWRGVLERIQRQSVGLSTLLGALEERGLIRREAVSRIQGDEQYTFKHGLLRQVAYSTVPRARRRERHATVARFLEETTTETGESAATLAFHWREAGDNERALPYFLAAAEYAGRGWAKERAVALYNEASALLPEDDVRRRDINRKRAVAFMALYHIPDAAKLAGRAEDLYRTASSCSSGKSAGETSPAISRIVYSCCPSAIACRRTVSSSGATETQYVHARPTSSTTTWLCSQMICGY
jgi:predicted ATPase